MSSADAVADVTAPVAIVDRIGTQATTHADAPPTIDPSLPGYFADPYAIYRTLRDTDPVHYSESLGAFFVTRDDDVHRLTRDRTLMVNIDFATSTPMIDAERSRLQELHSPPTILQLDGDDHNRLRRLVTRVFTPKAIASWRDRADTIVEGLLVGSMERHELDLIDDYALILPAQIISEMLGMPSKDIPDLRRWSDALSKTLDPINTPEEQQAATHTGRSMGGFINEVIDHKRIHPGDDILTALINAKDENQLLNTGELIVQVLTLYIAGHETTLNLIGNSMTHLFESPKQLDLLRTDPSNDANAIEELLRFDSPLQFMRRIAAESFVVGDTEIPPAASCFSALARRTAICGSGGRQPIRSTSIGRAPTNTSPLAAGPTIAWERRSPASKRRSPFPGSLDGFLGWPPPTKRRHGATASRSEASATCRFGSTMAEFRTQWCVWEQQMPRTSDADEAQSGNTGAHG